MAPAVPPAILPNPVFEGSEKRLEVDFFTSATSPTNGLRALTREQLDELMTLAHCTIVSSRSNAELDAYVLSESSLFVYPTKWVLKTCGTTRLLQSVPRLLEFAAALGMEPSRCKYTRASYLFPEQQHFPHTSFEDEVVYLDQHFGYLCGGSQAFVLGQPHEDDLQWHVYLAETTEAQQAVSKPTLNLEVIMTELGKDAAQQFFRKSADQTANSVTESSGIVNLKPKAIIDDYLFEPCGYSMNGILDSGLITIHITPEDGFSYASVEISGYESDMIEPNALLAAAVSIFNPGKVAMALTVSGPLEDHDSLHLAQVPKGYGVLSAGSHIVDSGGKTTFYNLSSKVCHSRCPKSVLHHAPSFVSLTSFAGCSDSELEKASASSESTEVEPASGSSDSELDHASDGEASSP